MKLNSKELLLLGLQTAPFVILSFMDVEPFHFFVLLWIDTCFLIVAAMFTSLRPTWLIFAPLNLILLIPSTLILLAQVFVLKVLEWGMEPARHFLEPMLVILAAPLSLIAGDNVDSGELAVQARNFTDIYVRPVVWLIPLNFVGQCTAAWYDFRVARVQDRPGFIGITVRRFQALVTGLFFIAPALIFDEGAVLIAGTILMHFLWDVRSYSRDPSIMRYINRELLINGVAQLFRRRPVSPTDGKE